MKKSTMILSLTLLVLLAVANTVFGYEMRKSFAPPTPSYQTTNDKSSNDDMSNSLRTAVIDKNSNTVTFKGQDVNIVLFGGPENADDKFVVGGLVNPTINVPKGSKVTLTLINEDMGMPHGMEIIASPPPYAYMSMMQGPVYPGAYLPVVPQAENEAYPTVSTTFTASQSGTFYYICQVPGHAAKGMYGEIVVE